MELKGKLRDIVRDVRTGAYQITLEVVEIPPGVDRLPEDLRINLTRWTNKRSLTANAYYWVLVTKLARVMHRSTSWIHNWLLCRYGQPEIIDGMIAYVTIKETAAAQLDVLESEEYHLKATSYVYVDHNGNKVREYAMMKHTKEYDTEEMAQLIDGAVDEAKAVGIETLPSTELERMMQDYEEHYHAG